MTANSQNGHGSGPRQVDDTLPMVGSKRTEFAFGDFDHSSIPLENEEYPVIIIGSSMVGMTLGSLLGYHGTKSVSFDRHPSTAIHPRAALFLLRTIEIMRQIGLEEVMTRESESMFDLDAGMVIVEQLVGGKTLMSLQQSDPQKVAQVTPSKRLWLTQNMFEPLLRKSAKELGAEQVFATTVVHYEEQSDGVIVVVQDNETKKYRKYKTSYLVSTDGNRSATRRKEGIEWSGPGILGNSISINFKANLSPHLGTRAVHGVTYISNPKIQAGFRLDDGGNGGFMIVTKAGERDVFLPDTVTEKDAKQYFRDATGIEDDVALKVESISYWSIAGYNSERFAKPGGRVFIAGDAAHVMPPTGGMGGNTGIQDIYNLAWKLAYIANGKASHALMDTYNAERQPVAAASVRQAYSRYQTRVDHKKPDEPELPDINCEIGYRYPTGAFISNGGKANEVWEDPYAPEAVAGGRLPHVELVEQSNSGKKISTFDLVRQNFVVIAAEESTPWIKAADSLNLKVDSYVLNEKSAPFSDPSGKARRVYKLGEGEALLVRPDGHIAWRAPRQENGHDAKLKEVLQTILKSSAV